MGKPVREIAADEGATAVQHNEKKSSRKSRTILFDVSNANKRRRSQSSNVETRAAATEERPPRRRSARLSGKDNAEANPTIDEVSLHASKRTRASVSLKNDDDALHQSEELQNVFKKSKQGKRKHSEVSNPSTELVESLSHSNLSTKLVESLSHPPSKGRRMRFSCSAASDSVDQENNYNLVCSPLDESKYTLGISKHDEVCREDVLRVPDYATDIFHRLYKAETRSSPTPYMEEQDEIDETMRMMLIDWLVEVHMKFKLEEETLFLCVNIIDRYLSVTNVERSKFQLVGVTALLLACKYEEIYPPLVKDCVYVTDRAYSRQDVLDMECEILRSLEFNISTPTAYPFLQRFLFMLNAKRTMGYAAHYYMDRVLLEHDMLNFRPSVIAAAAVCLAVNHPCIRQADNAKDHAPGIPEDLLTYTGFSKEHIEEVATWIAEKVSSPVQRVSRRQLSAVKDKYNVSRYRYISSYEPPDVADLWSSDD